MQPATLAIIAPMLERHEGKRLKPYKCTAGKLTIGIGRNLDDRGLSEDEVQYLFANDLRIAEADAKNLVGHDVYVNLTPARQAALIDMAFNLGYDRLAKFANTLLAVRQGRYHDAANGMLQSLWAKQVGGRAVRLAEMMRRG